MTKTCCTFFLAFALLFTTLPQAFAKKLEEQTWHEVISENFNLYSTLSVDESAELLHNLELLRKAIPAVTNIQTTESPIPTTIVTVKKASELRQFGFGNRIAGAYSQGLRNNVILMRSSKLLDTSHTILHEYVHYLTRNGSDQNYPLWYSEGFAEYFGSAARNGEVFELGRLPQDRLRLFRNCDWVAIKNIIKGYSSCLFYPESWALVHYIQTLPDHAKKMADYLQRLEQGEDNVDSFVAAFDVGITTLNSRVRQYVKKGKFSYIGLQVDELINNFETTSRPVSREEISLVLGQIALRRSKNERARHWLDIASTNDKYKGEAQSAMATLYVYDKDYQEAESYYERAVALEPASVPVLLDYGEYWLHRAKNEEDISIRDKYLKTARQYFGKAWKIDDGLPEVYAMYGRSYLHQEEYEKSLDTLTAANRLLPSDMGVRLDLAAAYIGVGNMQDAKSHAQAVKAWSHSESSSRKKAEELLQKIESSKNKAPDQ